MLVVWGQKRKKRWKKGDIEGGSYIGWGNVEENNAKEDDVGNVSARYFNAPLQTRWEVVKMLRSREDQIWAKPERMLDCIGEIEEAPCETCQKMLCDSMLCY